MFRSNRSRVRRRAFAALTLTVALAATAAPAGAAVHAAKEKVDKAAVLQFGLPIEDQGGVFFDPCSPRASANPSARMWMDLIYGTMIIQTEDGKGAPGLATKWSTPDANTVELTLREGVKFADGTPFNAAAVKAAWDCLLTGKRPNRSTDIQALSSIEAVNDNTVRIKLSSPVAANYVNDALKNAIHLAVPSPAAAATGTLDTKPVGAGPYQLKSYNTGKVTLEKNPAYYDKAAQKLAGYELIDTPLGPPGVSALQAGTVDAIWSFPPDAVATLEGTPGIEVFAAPSARQYQLGMCPTQGVFANKTARQAIQYAIDREAISEAALEGTGTPGQTILTTSSPYFNKALAKTYKFNPAKAKALLKEAGVAPGTKVGMFVPAQPPFTAIADVVQSQLKDVGLAPEVTQSTSFAADVARLKPDMVVAAIDPSLLSLFWEKESPLNACGFNSPALVSALNATRDPAKTGADLQAAWDTLQKTALDESVNVVTNLAGLLVAHNDKVENLRIVNSPYGPQLAGVYMTK